MEKMQGIEKRFTRWPTLARYWNLAYVAKAFPYAWIKYVFGVAG